MAFPWTAIFTDIGKMVKTSDFVKALDTDMDTALTESESVFDDDADDVTFLGEIITAINTIRNFIESGIGQMTARVNNYFTSLLKVKLESVQTTPDDVLVDMIAKMGDETQTVDGNSVSLFPSVETEAGDNNAQLSGYENIRGFDSSNVEQVGNQFLLYISIIDDGAGFFHVELFNASAKGGGDLIAHTATYNSTGAKALILDNASDIRGTITVDAVTAADTDITVTYGFGGDRVGTGFLTAWSASQMGVADDIEIEATDVSAAGAETWKVTSRVRGLFTRRATTGIAYPEVGNQDLAGINFLVNQRATAEEISGDVSGELSAWVLTGGIVGTNLDANGDTFNDLDALTALESGDNNAQLSLWTNITGLDVGANTDENATWHVNIVDDGAGFFHVDLYRDSGKAAVDLVGHTATYNSTGAKTIVPDNSSGLAGTLTVDAVTAADTDITYRSAVRRIQTYSDSGKTALVAVGGRLTSDGDGSITLNARNSSGLSGSVTLTWTDGETDVRVKAAVDFAVGDKFILNTRVTEDGTFQTWFRDNLDRALPFELDGTETVNDNLAE